MVMLTRFPMLGFTLEAADGTGIDRANVGSFNGQFVTGPVCHDYRMHLLVLPADFDRSLGKWQLNLFWR